MLTRADAGGQTPYDWLARAIPPDVSRVLDVGCGSGVMARVLAQAVPGRRTEVVGVDLSQAELARAAQHEASAGMLMRAEATRLPCADRSFDAVVSSMTLMVVERYDPVLRECARVLRPGGLLAVTVSSTVPLRASDVGPLTRVMARLRSVPQFPGGSELTGLKESLEGNGFRLLEDARERFAFAVHGRADADLLVGSLYLPDTADRRRDAAAAYLAQRAAGTDGAVDVPIPIRRVVAVRRDTP
ncbi:MAG: class I SAM-dependent methyltransferase [Actinomycetota bacterium]|nr:class I SAM-dependent methyltransferase [Actinomycetota bacterium]